MGTQLVETDPGAADTTYQRILVPVDGSPLAEVVLPHVVALARRFGSTVELVRAYAPPPRLLAASAASAMPGTGPVPGRAEAALAASRLGGGA